MNVMKKVVHLQHAIAVSNNFPVLAGIDFVVHQKEIVLLTGPNGAGKTSLLQLCGGLLPIAKGEGTVLDLNLYTHRKEISRHVGIVGHNSGLYNGLTVMENMQFWARAFRVTKQDIAEALERLAVEKRIYELPISQLSAGQKRKISFALLLMKRPQVWLLDEPHVALDHVSRDHVDGIMKQAAGAGATIIFSSHEQERATKIATRICSVVGGTIQESASSLNPELGQTK